VRNLEQPLEQRPVDLAAGEQPRRERLQLVADDLRLDGVTRQNVAHALRQLRRRRIEARWIEEQPDEAEVVCFDDARVVHPLAVHELERFVVNGRTAVRVRAQPERGMGGVDAAVDDGPHELFATHLEEASRRVRLH
jgi:hypothetical protein